MIKQIINNLLWTPRGPYCLTAYNSDYKLEITFSWLYIQIIIERPSYHRQMRESLK